MKWLEYAKEKMAEKVTEDLLTETYKLLSTHEKTDLELLINKITTYVAQKAYNMGFEEGLNIGRQLR